MPYDSDDYDSEDKHNRLSKSSDDRMNNKRIEHIGDKDDNQTLYYIQEPWIRHASEKRGDNDKKRRTVSTQRRTSRRN